MNVITLPIESSAPDKETCAHYIFSHRLDGLGTFIGEVLLATDSFVQTHAYTEKGEIRIQPRLFPNDMPEEERQQVIQLREEHGRSAEIIEQTSWFYEEPVPVPEIVWQPRKERRNLSGDLLRGLFHTGVTQLVSVYEIFIGDIARATYCKNHELLAIDEKQLTTAEIIQLGSYDNIIQSLIERGVGKLIFNVSYSSLVERFHRVLHVGIHDHASPVKLFPVHHLIEKRNIIVHNDGIASSVYVEKMKGYGEESVLQQNEQLPISFVSFYEDLAMIRELGHYIEKCIQERWPNIDYITYSPQVIQSV